MIHYAAFASNGVGVLPLSGFAAVLEGVGRICFTLLLMLVAKGHAVTSDQVDNRNALFLVLGGLLLLHFVMLVYDIAARDEASTLYLYETSPGIILVAATALTGAWFSNTIFQVWRGGTCLI